MLLSMKRQTKHIFAENVAALLAAHDMKESDLVRKTGLSQRTINNILNPDRDPNHSPRMEVVDKVGQALKVDGWVLLIPGIKVEVSESPKFKNLVYGYNKANQEGRDYISYVTEKEAKYSTNKS